MGNTCINCQGGKADQQREQIIITMDEASNNQIDNNSRQQRNSFKFGGTKEGGIRAKLNSSLDKSEIYESMQN